MSNIRQRLDALREEIQQEDFLNGRGLANEVNLNIFPYAPEDELTVRAWVSARAAEAHLRCRLHVRNLYEEFLQALQEADVLDACAEVEIADGKENLLEALRGQLSPQELAARLTAEHPQPGQDVLLVCGVGEIFPFLRVHSLLEALQPLLPNRLPVVVMYPGTYDGHYLQLFNKLSPNGYYRAFNLLCQ